MVSLIRTIRFAKDNWTRLSLSTVQLKITWARQMFSEFRPYLLKMTGTVASLTLIQSTHTKVSLKQSRNSHSSATRRKFLATTSTLNASVSWQESLPTGVRKLEREILLLVISGLKVSSTFVRLSKTTTNREVGPMPPGPARITYSTTEEVLCSSPGTIITANSRISSSTLAPIIARWSFLSTLIVLLEKVTSPWQPVSGSTWLRKTQSPQCMMLWLETLCLIPSTLLQTLLQASALPLTSLTAVLSAVSLPITPSKPLALNTIWTG